MSAFARLATDYASDGSDLSDEDDDATFAARYFDPVSASRGHPAAAREGGGGWRVRRCSPAHAAAQRGQRASPGGAMMHARA